MAVRRMVYDDLYELCRDERKLMDWLEAFGLIGDFSGKCVKCESGSMGKRKDSSRSEGYVWRCSNKKCNQKIVARRDSWFFKSHLSISEIMKLTFYWVYQVRENFVKVQLRLGFDHTLVDWYNYCRDVCLFVMEEENEMIGGPGIEVEIDESKFGKRKFHRGRRVDGVWVFGGIEKESNRMFLEVVEKRDADTLLSVLRKWVRPGSVIHSDCWKAYSRLNEMGYEHVTVNHSKEFVNAENGACTNKIESTWRAVKASLPRYGTAKGLYDSYFVEYIVRKKYLRCSDDPFLTFLTFIRRVFDPQKPHEYFKIIETENKENDDEFNSSGDLFL
ncbi:uncharacterized protein [Haliotis asinina]|uniref:uncharacterized protein n=1 Tax=Haliotis asinina TaxID=109174 RepID=UPI0035319722